MNTALDNYLIIDDQYCGSNIPNDKYPRTFSMIMNWNSWYNFIGSEPWPYANCYWSAIERLKRSCPKIISFDHDIDSTLDNVEYTGKTIADWIVSRDIDQRGLYIPEDFIYAVHSRNTSGSQNIKSLLDDYMGKKESGFFDSMWSKY